jgi:hypothetical protein
MVRRYVSETTGDCLGKTADGEGQARPVIVPEPAPLDRAAT